MGGNNEREEPQNYQKQEQNNINSTQEKPPTRKGSTKQLKLKETKLQDSMGYRRTVQNRKPAASAALA